MGITKLIKATLGGALSIGVLSSIAAAQDKPLEQRTEVNLATASTPREQQIELALSAAPAEVSSKATVYILGPKGYEISRKGTNGFSCLIMRSFDEAKQTTSAPACFDAEGSRTILLVYLRREELRAKGESEAEITKDVAEGFRNGRFKIPGPGFLYMMSNDNYVYDSQSKRSVFAPPHLMFYAPYETAKDIGYGSISPTMVPYLTDPGTPEALIVVSAEKLNSDTSTANSHKH